MKTLYGLREPSFKNMTDPSWLPSAIMQTTGAILGIYIGVYILVIQRYLEALEKLHEASTMPEVMEEGKKAMKSAGAAGAAVGAFYVLIFVCGFTIIANVLWLDALTNTMFIQGGYVIYKNLLLRDLFGVIGLSSFLFCVGYVCVFSILISKRLFKASDDALSP